MLDLEAIEERWDAQEHHWDKGFTHEGWLVFNQDVPALITEVRRLEGIIQADQERLTQAALRVGLHWGCDTPDAMADAIQEWQAETHAARERADRLEADVRRLREQLGPSQCFHFWLRREADGLVYCADCHTLMTRTDMGVWVPVTVTMKQAAIANPMDGTRATDAAGNCL